MKKRAALLFFLFLGFMMESNKSYSFTYNPSTGARKHKEDKEAKKADTLKPWQVDTLIQPVPINRQLFVEKVQKALNRLDARDGLVDHKIEISNDTFVSEQLTKIILHQIPLIDIHIENLPISNQIKIGYHRALAIMLNRFENKPFDSGHLPYFKNSTQNFHDLIIALQEGKVEEFAHDNANIYTIDNSYLLREHPKEKDYVFKTVGVADPTLLINKLPQFADESYADPIVAAAARVVPSVILNYATSTSYLSSVVRRNTDPLVQAIVKIASQSTDPLKALPFLGLIQSKKMTIAQADEAAKTPESYYKALVAAEIDNDSIGRLPLEKELDYRGLKLVRIVNSLHESPNPIRFASIMDYNAQELYFMIIASQDEIYTSSFIFMANRLIEKMAPDAGDVFLSKMHYYHFRTWIRMCAGYNMLSPFLGTMEEESKNNLMKQVVRNLEKGGSDDLEAAVDVADFFGSIKDPKLMTFLEKEVIKNYERCKGNEKGTIVYGLLSTIMKSANNSKQLTDKLSIIPPITFVPYKELIDSSKTVIIQAFFYGDEDGHMSFNSFESNFSSSTWDRKNNKYWVEFTYKGKFPIHVYANYPGDEKKNEDITAQDSLKKFFDQKDIHPTIVIHRGHSYHLQGSLKHLDVDVKIVMLGSCGGYHNLASVLDKSPDANIISSKQTGAMSVNEPIIRELLKQLELGENVNWIKSWKDLDKYFSSQNAHVRDMFSDYVPPNENLGAIFIKAYRKIRQHNEAI